MLLMIAGAASNHFEKLRGNLAGFHSIRVNNQWRLVFRWDDGHAEAPPTALSHRSDGSNRKTQFPQILCVGMTVFSGISRSRK